MDSQQDPATIDEMERYESEAQTVLNNLNQFLETNSQPSIRPMRAHWFTLVLRFAQEAEGIADHASMRALVSSTSAAYLSIRESELRTCQIANQTRNIVERVRSDLELPGAGIEVAVNPDKVHRSKYGFWPM